MSTSYYYLGPNPIIEFLVQAKSHKWNRFFAYVDSGASITVLTRNDADRLGIELYNGKRVELAGISGSLIAYSHLVKIKVAEIEFETEIAFSTSNETPRVLGKRGLFEKFIICFNDKLQKISFTKN